MVLPSEKDLDISEEKLQEVERVWKLVKDMSSSDANVVENAVKGADEYLKKKQSNGFSKTTINKTVINGDSSRKVAGDQSAEVTSFMRAVELDAAERHQRKALQRSRAEKLKDRANVFFKAGNWQRAIELYSQAIDACKDWEVLYTNRAQAYLRCGQAQSALADCDTALDLCHFHQNPDAGDMVQPNATMAKTHFHRGKALMALARPEDALEAYTNSRSCTTAKPVVGSTWPAYLVEYVAQAQVAIAAKQSDAKAEADFSARTAASGTRTESAEVALSHQLVCLLAKLARGNQDVSYYSAGLRQLTGLFSAAPVERPAPVSTKPAADSNRRSKGGRKRKSIANGSLPAEQKSTSQEILSDLQTLFRVKKGFSIIGREVNVICQAVEQPSTLGPPSSQPSSEDFSDRLLAVLNLLNWITRDCGENQRLLVDQHPLLMHLVIKCMTLSGDFVQSLVQLMPNCSDQHRRHKFEALRHSSAHLLSILTSEPSGRQALLNSLGAKQLLDALAVCLSESIGTPDGRPRSAGSNTSAISGICAARAAHILEHLTESPGFLVASRSSTASLESLLTVIEAALSASGGPGTLTTTTRTLSTLLDGLSGACHDESLRANLFQRRQALLMALGECLQRHAPLLTDPDHAQLVGSLCRLLHNICVGQLSSHKSHSSSSSSPSPSSFLSSGRLADTLLTAVGCVLQQPGHGPELRAVIVALAGRLLPLCSQKQVLSWFGESSDDGSEESGSISERGRLLLAVLDSCSLPPSKEPKTQSDSIDSATPDQDQLSSHMLGGCIRSLAAATAHSVAMRYAIGDDRRRVRRLARLIGAKLPNAAPPDSLRRSKVCSKPPVPRDEPLAGNACLILQHCCDDTPLAEHLQGTSVILDLLQLIQDSNKLDVKRNAAILIGKLAQASHHHRDELSRLDGWSVLTPFNMWNAACGRVS